MCSAVLKANGKTGQLREKTVRRSARSVRTQHDRRRKLCPLYRSTARLTHQPMTAWISRSPSCRTNLIVDSACTRVYTLNAIRLSRRHGSRTWRTRWIYIGGVAWRLYERFCRICYMVTAAVAHYQWGRGDVRCIQSRTCACTPCRFRHACITWSQGHPPKPHVPCCECREGYIMNPFWRYLNSVIVIQLFGRWLVQPTNTEIL